jgi:hypothetical protein
MCKLTLDFEGNYSRAMQFRRMPFHPKSIPFSIYHVAFAIIEITN